MDYDFRNRTGIPYDAQTPAHRPAASSSTPTSQAIYGHSLYPRIGQPVHAAALPLGRHSSYQQISAPSSASSSGLGIRIALKPEYRISPPPQLAPQMGEIPWSNFQFDFEFERKILAEVEKGNQNWSKLGLENLPSKTLESTSSSGSTADPLVSKYVASGLNRDAVPIAVANYGDNPTKVQEFVSGYTLLREMGFSSKSVTEALLMYANDTDKTLAHFLNSSS